jgi:hypothetical protein
VYPFPATEQYKESARYWVSKLSPRGSTNIHLALITAIDLCKNLSALEDKPSPKMLGKMKLLPETLPSGVQSMIIFLTDGDPTSGIIHKPHILRSVQEVNFKLEIPIFSLAFGKQADFEFLKAISLRNHGFAREIYENAFADVQLSDFYAQMSSLVLSNVTFEYTSSSPTFTNSVIEQTLKPGYFPMVFDGTELVIVRKLSMQNSSFSDYLNASIFGSTVSGRTRLEVPVRDCRFPGSSSCKDQFELDDMCMEKLFVYMTIKQLTKPDAADRAFKKGDKRCLSHLNMQQLYLSDYASYESGYKNCTQKLRNQAIDLAMQVCITNQLSENGYAIRM